MYESQFTARAEHYTNQDRRTADAGTARLLTSLARSFRLRLRAPEPQPRLRVVAGPACRCEPVRES